MKDRLSVQSVLLDLFVPRNHKTQSLALQVLSLLQDLPLAKHARSDTSAQVLKV